MEFKTNRQCSSCRESVSDSDWYFSYRRICARCDDARMIDQMERTGKASLNFACMPTDVWQAHCAMIDIFPYPLHVARFAVHHREVGIMPLMVKRFVGRYHGSETEMYNVWFLGPDGFEWYGRGGGQLNCRRMKQQSYDSSELRWMFKPRIRLWAHPYKIWMPLDHTSCEKEIQ